jgi:hypothetical protein
LKKYLLAALLLSGAALPARAIVLNCAAPIVSFGDANPGRDPVESVYVFSDGDAGAWFVTYSTRSGATISRSAQYDMTTQTSYWSGSLTTNPAIVAMGAIYRRANADYVRSDHPGDGDTALHSC